ncbi:hypothetical protein [Chlamydia psittaci]|uniref:hypothetical protein n=1 Tax=Chlamydia psittaci TaxID=83554 RepID=UPI00027E1EE4|nr:hypothetical protein [Chlamydia psittaci]AFS24621.1 hypothetical protein B602_0615 [Chlamydia psittaci M56]
MASRALGLFGATTGLLALACVLSDDCEKTNKPQRPAEYTVSSTSDAEFLLRDIEMLQEIIRTLHFALPTWLINDIDDIKNSAQHVLEVTKMRDNDNKTGLGILQRLFDRYYQVRVYLNSMCHIGDGTGYGKTLGNIKYFGSKQQTPHFTEYHRIQKRYPSRIQGKSRVMTITAIVVLSLMSLAALGTLGTLGGLSIVAAPISIGVSVAIALGFAITTIICIRLLRSKLVTKYEEEIIPVSSYPRPFNWDKPDFY